MLLDNGDQVFLWLGSRSSEVEVKLTYKAAQVISLSNGRERGLVSVNGIALSIFFSGVHATFTSSATSTNTTVVSYLKIQRD